MRGAKLINEPQPKEFREFPIAVRIAQNSLLFSLAIILFSRRILRGKAIGLRLAVLGAASVCALVGLVATYFVVIRYPYIGMVDAKDGDLYSKYIEGRSKWVFGLLKVLGLVGPMGLISYIVFFQPINAMSIALIVYLISILAFCCYLAFFYDRFEHPAVATFLRCSMGMGVFLFPAFIPALFFGTLRAKRLLDLASRQLEQEHRLVSRSSD